MSDPTVTPLTIKWTTGLVASIYTFVSWVFVLGAWAVFAKPEWGPLLGAAFGCFAFSIAVQQLYASRTQAKFGSEQFVYLWSSLTLFVLGIGTVFACLPSIVQIGWTPGAQRVLFLLSAVLLTFGFITLFRFGAAYLYRDKTALLSGNLSSVFKWRDPPLIQSHIEVIHFLFCLSATGIAILTLDDLTALPAITDKNPIYFPFPFTKIALCLSGIVTGICLAVFFKDKFGRIRRGEALPGGIRFMAAMGILFFVPCIVQITTLLSWPKWTGMQPSMVAILGLWSVVFVSLIGYFGLIFKNDNETSNELVIKNVRAVKRTIMWMLVLCLAFTTVLLLAQPLLHIIPFGFITLGFLTLACAYLPIDDLERLKVEQQSATQ
jgi:hypothetical protein